LIVECSVNYSLRVVRTSARPSADATTGVVLDRIFINY